MSRGRESESESTTCDGGGGPARSVLRAINDVTFFSCSLLSRSSLSLFAHCVRIEEDFRQAPATCNLRDNRLNLSDNYTIRIKTSRTILLLAVMFCQSKVIESGDQSRPE